MKKSKYPKKKLENITKKGGNIETKNGLFQKLIELLNRRSYRVCIVVVLLLVNLIYFAKDSKFPKFAQFGFDQWEYQSMAVNFAKGHGINKFGCIENFEEYKFGRFNEYYDGKMDVFVKQAGDNDFYRTPGYPVFLGLIYKIFGINHDVGCKVTLIFIIVLSSLLPLFAYYFWKLKGFLIGILAFFLSIQYHMIFVSSIGTESLTTISYFLLIFAWLLYHLKQNIFSSVIFGIFMGIGLLIKGSFVFIPIIFCCYFLWSYFNTRLRTKLIHLFFIILSSILIVLPWSYYASSKSKSVIILSTQGSVVLLDSHNEFSNGGWAPGWKNDKNSFYNNDGMQNSSAMLRVINFYKHFPKFLPELFVKKVVFGFIPFIYLWLIIATLFVDSLGFFILKYLKSKKVHFASFLFIAIPLYSVIIYIWNYDYENFYDGLANHYYIFFFVCLIPFVMYIIKTKLDKAKEYKILKIPIVLKIILINFFLITTILLAEIFGRGNRYVAVINFIFIIIALIYIVSYFQFSIKTMKEN